MYTVTQALKVLEKLQTLKAGDTLPEKVTLDGEDKPLSLEAIRSVLDDHVTTVNGESASRKHKLRELQATIDEKNTLVKELSDAIGANSANPGDLTAKIAEFSNKYSNAAEKESQIKTLQEEVDALKAAKVELENTVNLKEKALVEEQTNAKTLAERAEQLAKEKAETSRKLSVNETTNALNLRPTVFSTLFDSYQKSVGKDVQIKLEDVKGEGDTSTKEAFFVTIDGEGESAKETRVGLSDLVKDRFSDLADVLYLGKDTTSSDSGDTRKPIAGGSGKKVDDGKKPVLGSTFLNRKPQSSPILDRFVTK
jgi:DNA repair exonuclease SbcCD ATPase subunit